MDAKKIGALIAQLRKTRGLTQKALAEKLHVSDKAVSRWETGKGFPDTSLLKPLSDALGISVGELLAGELIPREELPERVDAVIVDSLQASIKKQRKGMLWLFLLPLIFFLCLTICALHLAFKPVPMDVMVNQSKTYMRYHLGAEYGDPIYDDLISYRRADGYECMRADGSERYVFTFDEQGSAKMTYMHCSGNGMLFGFRIGDPTVFSGNDSLNVSGYALTEYLQEQGFQWEHDDTLYGRPTLVYINGERCNWMPYVKGNICINLCLSAYPGRKLMAYDIGFTDPVNETVWNDLETGFSLTVEDPFNLLQEKPKTRYPQWEPVTLTAKVPDTPNQTLYFYVNGTFCGKGVHLGDHYQFTMMMPGAHATVLITPEEQK